MNERISEIIEGDPIAKAIIASHVATIALPPGLVGLFVELVHDYAAQHREAPGDCCRAVEITILQRGIAAMRGELKANAALGVRMGWREKEEESGT